MYYVDIYIYICIYAVQHYTDPNLEQSGRSEKKNAEFSGSLTSEVGFNYWCLAEVPQEYYCVYFHLNFVSVESTSSVFHQ